MGVSWLTVTVTAVGATAGVPIAGTSTFLAFVAPLKTDYLSKVKIRYMELQEFFIMGVFLSDMTSRTPFNDKLIDQKQSEGLKNKEPLL